MLCGGRVGWGVVVGGVDVEWAGGEQGWGLPGSLLMPWDGLSACPVWQVGQDAPEVPLQLGAIRP